MGIFGIQWVVVPLAVFIGVVILSFCLYACCQWWKVRHTLGHVRHAGYAEGLRIPARLADFLGNELPGRARRRAAWYVLSRGVRTRMGHPTELTPANLRVAITYATAAVQARFRPVDHFSTANQDPASERDIRVFFDHLPEGYDGEHPWQEVEGHVRPGYVLRESDYDTLVTDVAYAAFIPSLAEVRNAEMLRAPVVQDRVQRLRDNASYYDLLWGLIPRVWTPSGKDQQLPR